MKFAVVGYGKMGKFYAGLLDPKFIVDILPVAGKVCFNNVDEFIAYKQVVDLVIVATPSNTHFKVATKLLENGYDIVVEKPMCLSSVEAKALEDLAWQNKRLLYQTTLERYNPLVKFLSKNVAKETIDYVESYRFGTKPPRSYVEDPKFDLGVHDIDLWFYLYQQKIPWNLHYGYGEPRREIVVHLRGGKKITLDLLHKHIVTNGHSLDYSKASANNPILEMVYDIIYQGRGMNENWSEEIRLLEEADGSPIELNPVL